MLQIKRYRTYEKRLRRERNRWRKRCLRRAEKKRKRPGRIMTVALILAVSIYLILAGRLGERILQVRQESVVVHREEESADENGSSLETLYKIIFRLKTGEIVFFHQRTRQETLP